jgi:hypothetical protein
MDTRYALAEVRIANTDFGSIVGGTIDSMLLCAVTESLLLPSCIERWFLSFVTSIDCRILHCSLHSVYIVWERCAIETVFFPIYGKDFSRIVFLQVSRQNLSYILSSCSCPSAPLSIFASTSRPTCCAHKDHNLFQRNLTAAMSSRNILSLVHM